MAEEWIRQREVNNKKQRMPCFFNDGLSEDKFREFANKVGKKIKRIKDISTQGAIVECKVESQTGYTYWSFSVDFNNWGHVTGKRYWIYSENYDSAVPNHFASMMSELIKKFYDCQGIELRDLSAYVNENTDLETEQGLNYAYKEKFLKRLFRITPPSVKIFYDYSELLGEHLYPVISMIKATGFKNIKTIPIKDINDKTTKYYYQVEQVIIAGSGFFQKGMTFLETAEIIITYHEKQIIQMPFSSKELKRNNYMEVKSKLHRLGYTHIYEKEIQDLVTGWIIKEGTVEMVLLNGETDRFIEKNVFYDYDQNLTICYHTKKPSVFGTSHRRTLET